MSRIITFLGRGSDQITLSVATAHWFAQRGSRVLLMTHHPSADAEILLETPLTTTPQDVAPNFQAVQLQTTTLLDQAWDELKQWLTMYLPDAIAVEVYPHEMMILPGFDSALTFNALRHYHESGRYDVLVYHGCGDLNTLRLLGLPNILEWYFRRAQGAASLDLSRIAESVGGPLAGALVSANLDNRKLQEGMDQVRAWLNQTQAMTGQSCLSAYLITTDDPGSIGNAQWLWGSAQQVGISVNGVLVYGGNSNADRSKIQQPFDPLTVNWLPTLGASRWDPLLNALPNFNAQPSLPPPVAIDIAQRQVQVFLPGFAKHQVRLTQTGSELTVEAGDQRRNIVLPAELQGQTVTAGKFEAPYLTISL
ncbi:MAG: ArsA family ATPase [Synechococcales cyanobacterium C42_A2020_086]|nr:ArsA family ATPase [Synechococcales cyanobacterium M58_A2018_015]MBF2073308.1 ArsA family ATPase [Synechococcales cyanobacterium C42_A2020_086]